MKNLMIALGVVLTLFSFIPNMVFAAGSKTIGVSVVIPAIPGVNAPPFPENTKNSTAAQLQSTAKNDSQETKQTSNQQASFIVTKDLKNPQVQTIYSR